MVPVLVVEEYDRGYVESDPPDLTELVMLLTSDLKGILEREEARAIQDSLPPHAQVCRRRRVRIREVIQDEYLILDDHGLQLEVMAAQTETIAPLYVVELLEQFRETLREKLAEKGKSPNPDKAAFLDAVYVAVLMLP